MNDLPEIIEACEFEKTCGNTVLGHGIVMLDENDEEICQLTNGTIREKNIALLWQASPQLLMWAKEACESERAFYDSDRYRTAPSWLPELEAAVRYAESGRLK